MMRYHHVDTMKAEGFAVRAACRAAEISASSYYEWKERDTSGPSESERSEHELLTEIRAIHADSDQSYGSPRMARELRRRGRRDNHKRVERLMARHELVGITERRRVCTTIPAEDAPPPRTSSSGASRRVLPMSPGPATSRTSEQARAGSTSRACSTSGAGACLVGRWTTTWRRRSSPTRCPTQSGCAVVTSPA